MHTKKTSNMNGILIKACIVSIILSILVFSAHVELTETSIEKSVLHQPISTDIDELLIGHLAALNRTRRNSNRIRLQPKQRKRHRYRNPNCKKVDFNVNFSELGWEKFIIYPKVFNAYLCSGSCMLPYKRRMYMSSPNSAVPLSTNHAQIMSILEFKNPTANREMTKCVSTKLKPLTVIFVDENGQIKTKVYQDMIVDECGCR